MKNKAHSKKCAAVFGSNARQKSTRYTKSTLPSKICVTCGRPFNWRKKWEKVWDEVKYCSDRCRKG